MSTSRIEAVVLLEMFSGLRLDETLGVVVDRHDRECRSAVVFAVCALAPPKPRRSFLHADSASVIRQAMQYGLK